MFDKILGNDQLKKVFQRLLVSQKIPRSLLFVGEDGIGKRAFALEIAKAAVCQNPIDGEACDQCPACRRSDKIEIPHVEESTKVDDRLKEKFKKVFFTAHPDIGLVVPLKKNIFVDAVRELETEANFRPYEAKARFFLIDNADKMSDAAANALLKTLEEPPPTSHIFLITSRPASLLSTIRSRCQIIRFAPLDRAEIESHLREIQHLAVGDAKLAAMLCGGSLGRALAIDPARYSEQRETMLGVLESLSGQKNIAALLKTAEEINDAKNKDNFLNYLQILQNLLHDVWIITLGESLDKVINSDLQQQLAAMSRNFEGRKLALWIKEIESFRETLAVNVNKKIATDALFMQMSGG